VVCDTQPRLGTTSDPVVHQLGPSPRGIICARSSTVQADLIRHGICDGPSRFMLAAGEIQENWAHQLLEVGNGHDRMVLAVGFADSVSRTSRSAMRRSWNRRLERAAVSRSSRVRLSVLS
jgi:hypothetical protein